MSITTGDISFVIEQDAMSILLADSNSGCTDGPRRYYIPVMVCNNTGATVDNLSIEATLSNSPSCGLSTCYALANDQPSTQLISSLVAGACETQYWYISYPCNSSIDGIFNFTATDIDDSSTATGTLIDNASSSPIAINVFSALSTNATGLATYGLPNGSSVSSMLDPITYNTTNPVYNDGIVGGTLCVEASIFFDKPSNGEDYWIQPTGNLNFDAGMLQLQSVEIISVTSGLSCAFSVGDTDMYYMASGCTNGPGGASSGRIYVRYCFEILEAGSTTLVPFAYGQSGSQFKFNFDIAQAAIFEGEPIIPAPVEFGYFNGTTIDKMNQLKWNTYSEENSSHFEVESSKDGIHFEWIGTVMGHGQSVETIHYEYLDEYPFATTYYRLKQVDLDGSYEYSDIIRVEREKKGMHIQNMFPNPTVGPLTLQFNSNNDLPITINIIDISGKIIRTQVLDNVILGDNQLDLDISTLSDGMYFISLVNDEYSTIKRIVKH